MKITYRFLGERMVTRHVFGDITFEIDEYGNAFAKFASGGHYYSVSVHNIINIEAE